MSELRKRKISLLLTLVVSPYNGIFPLDKCYFGTVNKTSELEEMTFCALFQHLQAKIYKKYEYMRTKLTGAADHKEGKDKEGTRSVLI